MLLQYVSLGELQACYAVLLTSTAAAATAHVRSHLASIGGACSGVDRAYTMIKRSPSGQRASLLLRANDVAAVTAAEVLYLQAPLLQCSMTNAVSLIVITSNYDTPAATTTVYDDHHLVHWYLKCVAMVSTCACMHAHSQMLGYG
eukprot:20578-Heterococcus_DN1.PRE.3